MKMDRLKLLVKSYEILNWCNFDNTPIIIKHSKSCIQVE